MTKSPQPQRKPVVIPDLPAGLSDLLYGPPDPRTGETIIGIRPAPGCDPGHITLTWDQLAGFKARHNLRTRQVVQWPNAGLLIILEPVPAGDAVSAETLPLTND